MRRNKESALFESVREWVLRHLPIQKGDDSLVAYLQSQDAHSLLVIYHNWQTRLVSEEPRRVHCSSALNGNELSDHYRIPLAAIIGDIQAGNSLSKYLSKDIRITATLPGKGSASKRRRDLDLMLNDWGMHHLHLSTSVECEGFVSRTKHLLFAVFRKEDAYLLDIADHESWTSTHLVETLVREFPHSDTFYVLEGVTGLSKEVDEGDRKSLRNGHVNSPIMIDGKAVMLTTGMNSTGTTVAAVRDADMVLAAIEDFEQAWAERPDQIRAEIQKSLPDFPEMPDFTFYRHETAGLGIFDKTSKVFIPLRFS